MDVVSTSVFEIRTARAALAARYQWIDNLTFRLYYFCRLDDQSDDIKRT